MNFKRVLITGTTSGLGRAFRDYYLKQGAEVLSVNRRHLKEADPQFVIDITRYEEVLALLSQLKAAGRFPDLMVLNAGINKPDNQGPLAVSTFEEVWRINFSGALNFVAASQALGVSGVTFAGLSSTSNIVPNPGHLAYFLSKQGLKDAFAILKATDRANRFKTVILSPVATGIMGKYGKPKGLQGWIYDRLVVSAENAAAASARFFASDRSLFYFTKPACIFYFAVRILLKAMPSLYSGTPKESADATPPLPLSDRNAPAN